MDLLYHDHHDEIHGDLFTQVEKTMDLLRAGITYQGIQRMEAFSVPEPALREAVLNAIVHKDYASGAPIKISVHADKLMLWNSGQLPPHWTVAKLKQKHSSQPFNPDIANAFFRAGRIEAWGRGIELMLGACRQAGVPEPVLAYETSGLWVTFSFPNLHENPTTPETTLETTPETTPEKIVALLQANPSMTRRQIAQQVGITLEGIRYHLKKLKVAGRIRHVGPTKAGHWEILK